MWWILAAWASPLDFSGTVIEGELARPQAQLVFARPSDEAAPPEARELLRQARAQELLLLRAQDRGEHDPELAAAVERAYEQVIAAYRQVMARADLAASAWLHAQLGFLLEARQRPEEAAKEWQAGLALDPRHPLARASHLALGEHLFANGALLPAMAHYEQASSDPELGRYAWYKLAWCQHNLGQTEQAVEAVLRAVDRGQDPLARQARRDLPLFVVSSSAEVARQALARACAGQQACLDDLLSRLAQARAEVGLPPLP